jgi:hypothetical protein
MIPFEKARNDLSNGGLKYQHLDAVQLVKHAFGVRTASNRSGTQPILVYLYAEPKAWPNGRAIDPAARRRHVFEIKDFAKRVEGAEVRFVSCSYGHLIAAFRKSPLADVRHHAAALRAKFGV